jgi:hypothetical protein
MTATADDSSCIAPVTYMEYPAHATKLQKIVRGVRAEGWGGGWGGGGVLTSDAGRLWPIRCRRAADEECAHRGSAAAAAGS